MAVVDDLEAELHDRLDDRTLTIYADHLQTLGDPRGELIALDLQGVASDVARRGELLAAWLGADTRVWRDDAEGVWWAGQPEHTFATFDRGFMDLALGAVTSHEPFTPLLAGPAGPYLRRMLVAGSAELLRIVFRELVATPRPWLCSLDILSDSLPDELHEPIIDAALHDALCAATPRLERLHVSGRNVFRALAHPGIREISLIDEEAIGLPDGPAMPSVTTIDLRFELSQRRITDALARLVTPSRFPSLRHLKLGGTEPSARLFPMLGQIAAARQLTHLVLPSPRSRLDLELAQAAIDSMPSLHVVEIARAYRMFAGIECGLRHRSARIKLPAISPWPPIDMVDPLRVLKIESSSVDILVLIDRMETQYAGMPEAARDAWDRFWHAVEYLGWHPDTYSSSRVGELPATVMVAALDGVDIEALEDLRAELAQSDANRPIRIRWQ